MSVELGVDSMVEDEPLGRLVVPSIVLSRVMTQPPLLITGLLLLEIAQTFEVPVGMAGQLNTSASILVVLGSLAMSYLTLRFDQKTLLLTGLALFCCSFLGCYLSPAFSLLLISFAVQGVARAMVDPMTTSFVGRLIPVEKRGGIISLFFAGLASVFLVLSPLVGYLSNIWSWRVMFLVIALPFPVVAFILSWYALPGRSERDVSG
jgi:predicted MFS family arabinose efflux permease